MIINGKETDFKISRKSDAQRFENALRRMEEEEKAVQGMQEKEGLTGTLEALRNMFVDFFKEITEVDVIGECDDLEEIQKMYFEFLKCVNDQQKMFLKPFSTQRIK